MPQSRERVRDRIRGFLIGTAIGDAMGVPLEGRPPCEGIEPGVFWEGFLPVPEDPGTPPGRTSDDTQLTVLGMLSLQSPGGFKPYHLAELFCREFRKHRTDGWGLSTVRAVGKMVYEGESWENSGCPVGMAGNGAAMRAGPFGLWPWSSQGSMVDAVVSASEITHRDPEACAAAAAVAAAHRYLSTADKFCRGNLAEKAVPATRALSEGMASVLELALGPEDPSLVLEKLSLLGDSPAHPATRRRGISGYVVPSVAAAFCLFAAFPEDPKESLGRAMLAGGDTDTVGSLIAGFTGTLAGSGIWPDHLATNVRNYENLLAIADSFAESCWGEMSDSIPQS